MLPFLKKKSEAAAAPLVPAWHPNFRSYEKLPDIKVVRTAFFVNGAAVSVALALLIYFAMQEWQLRGLSAQIADAQRQIDQNKSGSDKAVVLYKKFQAEEVRVAEVETFMKLKPIVSDIVVHLGQTLPPNIAFDGLDFRDNGLLLRLTVRGTSDAALGYATNYLEQLRADKKLGMFDDFSITTSTRNPGTGRLAVEIFFRLRGPNAKKP
eukprot:TRINITY_DN27773_c0_g1_i1.p3 TRINITY_DN27773_c0_g1~~TRINITY_DN27773_c0_g1_i1.p3  ORF type:complete len:209 (-),score=45.18 TRINITY_DN27773_c0_g1_i1:814-1440(-)